MCDDGVWSFVWSLFRSVAARRAFACDDDRRGCVILGFDRSPDGFAMMRGCASPGRMRARTSMGGVTPKTRTIERVIRRKSEGGDGDGGDGGGGGGWTGRDAGDAGTSAGGDLHLGLEENLELVVHDEGDGDAGHDFDVIGA